MYNYAFIVNYRNYVQKTLFQLWTSALALYNLCTQDAFQAFIGLTALTNQIAQIRFDSLKVINISREMISMPAI